MKIAITTTNGKDVDLHFGKAKSFTIYKLVDSKPEFVETRSTQGYCSGGGNHEFNSNKLDLAYEAIKDCRFLCTAKIGETPAKKLEQKGMNIIEFEGSLEDIFESI